MKIIIFSIAILSFASCSREKKGDKKFIENVIELTTQTSTGEVVQFPGLYDTLTHFIPEDKDESLIIVEELKERGFKITEWGRGNLPPLGPRIVIVELRNGNCACTVSKMYYSTTVDSIYQMVEGLACKKIMKKEQ